jgi:hypothetical protein
MERPRAHVAGLQALVALKGTTASWSRQLVHARPALQGPQTALLLMEVVPLSPPQVSE